MRLTLRTLLAYMDEILEPSDREELGKKVESSEFAHDLIHRTKDTMRRLRLSAPQVVGTGIGLDPNTVAEYLDNVLPPDAVADFERICLESDVHLAEVAAAHHVLTMVLGEPAEVDPAARQRMYAIPAEAEQRRNLRVEQAHSITPPVRDYAAAGPPPPVYPPVAPAPIAQPVYASPSHDSVPDYLRASSWTRHGTLIAACAAVLVLAVSWLVYTGMSGWSGGPEQVAARAPKIEESSEPASPPVDLDSTQSSAATESPTVTELTDTPPAAVSETAAVETTTIVEETISRPLAVAPSMPTPPRMPVPAMSHATPPAATTEPVAAKPPAAVDESAYGYNEPSVTEPVAPATAAPVVGIPIPQSPQSASAMPSSTEPATPVIPSAPLATAPIPITPPQTENIAAEPVVTPDPAALAASTTPVPPVAESVASTSAEPSAEPTEPVEVGTYLDGKNVLLRFDHQAGAWFRMTPRAPLHPADKLLALPAFFPKLTLASGLHLKLVGGSMITFGPEPAGATVPSIIVDYGKVVLVNTTNGETALKLTIGGESADVRLSRNATVAVHVVPQFSPGQDPRSAAATIVADVFTRDGDVTWTTAAGAKNIAAPAHWKIDGGIASVVAGDVAFPDWIDNEPVEQLSEQRFGAPTVEAALDPSRPVETQLLELYQSSRRREVKSLVARSAVYAGLFVPFVEALRDSDQKSAWKMHIDTLRGAMALGPESSQRIYDTLVDQRGKAAADELYQMLCGYSVAEIGAPEAFREELGTKLVDRMEDDSLDYRVLAVQAMAEITGMRLMPNPAGSPSERARGVRLWRQRLKSGEVAPVAAATP